MSKKCQYCGTPNEKGVINCIGCQAPLSEQAQSNIRTWERSPFLYNGYIVWGGYDPLSNHLIYHFYLGDRLVETIKVDRHVISRFVPRFSSVVSFIWELFKVAQGEQEVFEIQEQNTVRPARFEIRVKRTLEDEWLEGLSREDFTEAYLEYRREFAH